MAPPLSEDDITIDTESPASFAKLMALRQMSTEEAPIDGSSAPTEKVVRFCSLSKPFSPGSGGRAFGGHVYAQAAYAASKTVGVGFNLHVCMPFFFLLCCPLVAGEWYGWCTLEASFSL
jgi:hypothetical protein